MSQEKTNYMDTNNLLKELMTKQLKNISSDKKLQYSDLKRICKYINKSIFDEKNCCIWDGYITNVNNLNKGTYINFYFRKKKVALHRLLFINFVGHLKTDEYLKFTCENKGKCCNLSHLKKFSYQKKNISVKKKQVFTQKIKKNLININTLSNLNSINLSISFD
ncbi:Hypothetical protein KVN_LOCUS320 [uncultured virus]|nr:Hypothetical protein KVN_LOCUS320 [uncultured virus]